MRNEFRPVIITGASKGNELVKANLERHYAIVANSRNITKSGSFASSDELALVDGEIGALATAQRVIQAANGKFESVNVLVNNAGIFFSSAFTDYSIEDLESLLSTNIKGFIYINQRAIKRMAAQKSGGSIVSITTMTADHPIAA
jgi:NAD(P)-dependent dehydrogenase (short-subunit alcohol dehydrogenase family)